MANDEILNEDQGKELVPPVETTENLFYTEGEQVTAEVDPTHIVTFEHLDVSERLKIAQAIRNNIDDPAATAEIMATKITRINGVEGPFTAGQLLRLRSNDSINLFARFARTLLNNATVRDQDEKKSD